VARVGPNQDINDPTTILEVGKFFYDKSVDFGILKAISDTENPLASGSPIPTVTIPLKLMDGSTYSLDCSRITDNFTVDEPKLGESVLNTYIDLAERFREYWLTMRNTLFSLDDSFNFGSTNVSPDPSGSQLYGGYITGVSGSFGGKMYTINSIEFFTNIPDIPIWSGYGPINYNYNTYPQLLNVIDDTLGDFIYNEYEDVDAVYYWKKSYGTKKQFGINPSMRIYAGSAFDSSDGGSLVPAGGETREKFIQIPNLSTIDMTIHVIITADYYGECKDEFAVRSEFAQVRIVSGIGNYNGYDSVDIDSTIHQLDLPDIAFSGVRTINLSINEEIIIPPGKSAFLTMDAYITTDIHTGIGPVFMEGDTSVEIVGVAPVQVHSELSHNYP